MNPHSSAGSARGPAAEIISRFGSVEDDQRYTRLVDLFTDDATYYDPFFGPQRGKAAIRSFMEHMEQMVPASGARFDEWHSEGDEICGWSTWTMVARGPSGEVPVPGQSLYRLRYDTASVGAPLKVCFAADYVDPLAYAQLRPDSTRRPDLAGGQGLSIGYALGEQWGRRPAHDLIRTFWQIQDDGDYARLSPLFTDDAVFTDLIYGRMAGGKAIADYMTLMKREMPAQGVHFQLVDCAGDTNVAWSQWTCHFAPRHGRRGGAVPGWTLHTVRDGLFTLDADYFDRAEAKLATQPV
jgi:steroid Delta-isomerase